MVNVLRQNLERTLRGAVPGLAGRYRGAAHQLVAHVITGLLKLRINDDAMLSCNVSRFIPEPVVHHLIRRGFQGLGFKGIATLLQIAQMIWHKPRARRQQNR